MAAQEYYQSFQPQPQGPPPPYPSSLGSGHRPSVAPVQSPYNQSPQPSQFHPSQFLQPPGSSYPPPVSYQGPQQTYGSQANLHPNMYALTPSRSKSEPPENRRASLASSHHHHHRHSRHSDSRSRSRGSRSRSRSRDNRSRSRSGSGHHHHHHHDHDHHKDRSRTHSGRDTFIGAGAGGLIGDALFPGLGTLWGALAGGVGGYEYGNRRRSKSDTHHKDGITVHSGLIRR